MSQITRCPACETQFKVASDQLRASEGWVRCGQCDEIFDAVAHLVPLDAFPVLSQVVPAHRREAVPAVAPAVQPSSPPRTPEERSARPAAEPSPEEAVASEPVAAPDVADAPLPISPEEPPSFAQGLADAANPAPGVQPEPSSIDDLANPMQQASDASLVRAPEPSGESLMASAGFDEAIEAEEEPSIDLDFPSLAAVDPLPDELLEEEDSGGGDAAQDNAVDAGLLGAKLSFPDDARRPVSVDEPDLLSDRIAAEMDEVVLHLHESAAEPPVPDWMAQASALDGASVPATQGQPSMGAVSGSGVIQEAFAPLSADLGRQGDGPSLSEEFSESSSTHLSESARVPTLERAVEPGAAALGAGAGLAAAAAAETTPPPVSRWERLGVRIALGCATALLVLGLLVQAAVQWRESILGWNRHSLGVLQALCVPFQCTLASPRRIADVVIDASGFRHLQGSQYELSMTLHNRSAASLLMPVLELTLTDAQEQPLVRRVLQPAELDAPAELLAKKRWEATVPVALTVPDLPVAGYRLLAFYP